MRNHDLLPFSCQRPVKLSEAWCAEAARSAHGIPAQLMQSHEIVEELSHVVLGREFKPRVDRARHAQQPSELLTCVGRQLIEILIEAILETCDKADILRRGLHAAPQSMTMSMFSPTSSRAFSAMRSRISRYFSIRATANSGLAARSK